MTRELRVESRKAPLLPIEGDPLGAGDGQALVHVGHGEHPQQSSALFGELWDGSKRARSKKKKLA